MSKTLTIVIEKLMLSIPIVGIILLLRLNCLSGGLDDPCPVATCIMGGVELSIVLFTSGYFQLFVSTHGIMAAPKLGTFRPEANFSTALEISVSAAYFS